MITSPDNDKLKLARKLAQRKHRAREGLFVTEGEDLLAAGLSAGREPAFVLVAAGSGLAGEEVEPGLLDGASALGSGTRAIGVWRQDWAQVAEAPCVYLHGVSDPGNVGAIIRSADALTGGTVLLGPQCADPYSAKAVRASMGSIFGVAIARGTIADAPEPRLALIAHGGSGYAPAEGLGTPATICLGPERDPLGRVFGDACQGFWTIPLREGGAESLNVAAAAAIALQRISSAAAEASPGSGSN